MRLWGSHSLPLSRHSCATQDSAAPYLDVVKALYKELLTVSKGPSGSLAVTSTVLAVTELRDASGAPLPLFPHENPHSVCWVIINGAAAGGGDTGGGGQRHGSVCILYHAWVPFW